MCNILFNFVRDQYPDFCHSGSISLVELLPCSGLEFSIEMETVQSSLWLFCAEIYGKLVLLFLFISVVPLSTYPDIMF